MRVLPAIVLTMALLTPVCSSGVVVAAGTGSGSGGSSGGTISAGEQFGTPPAAKGKADSSGCTWMPAGEAQIFDVLVVTEKIVNGIKYVLFFRSCPKSGQSFWVPQIGPPTLANNASDTIQQRLPKPTMGSAPAADRGVVKVGMWFWTDPARYRPVSVTAWVPTLTGIAWATTTAIPVRLVFASGEPGSSPTTCQGPGRKWLPQFGDDLASSCMYTYVHSSEVTPTKVFDAQLSIVWSVSWRSNVGSGGNLGQFVSTTNQAVTVDELQAVVRG